MPHTITKEVYDFAELNDRAKERARDWYRDGALDYDWYDCVYNEAARIAEMLGIVLKQKPVKLMSGKTRYEPCFWFTGFASQGDGACFEGTYYYAKGAVAKLKADLPTETRLHDIAQSLMDVQRRYGYRLQASVEHRGHYYHERSVDIDVTSDSAREVTDDDAETVRDGLRDFMRWLYRALEAEHDYLLSDDVIDDMMDANGYTFDENGRRAD